MVLGDRPIEITLQRAWSSLPWHLQLRLCWDLLKAAALAPSQVGRGQRVGSTRSVLGGEVRQPWHPVRWAGWGRPGLCVCVGGGGRAALRLTGMSVIPWHECDLTCMSVF